jgi:hypothetical protein
MAMKFVSASNKWLRWFRAEICEKPTIAVDLARPMVSLQRTIGKLRNLHLGGLWLFNVLW